MEELDLKKIQRVAELSKIEIKDEEELKNLSTKIKSIVAHSERLNDLDLSDVEPMTHAMQLQQETSDSLRKDKAGNLFHRKKRSATQNLQKKDNSKYLE